MSKAWARARPDVWLGLGLELGLGFSVSVRFKETVRVMSKFWSMAKASVIVMSTARVMVSYMAKNRVT